MSATTQPLYSPYSVAKSPCLNGFYDTSGNPPPVTLMAAALPNKLLVLCDNVAGIRFQKLLHIFRNQS
jgi:hypothetical protein